MMEIVEFFDIFILGLVKGFKISKNIRVLNYYECFILKQYDLFSWIILLRSLKKFLLIYNNFFVL